MARIFEDIAQTDVRELIDRARLNGGALRAEARLSGGQLEALIIVALGENARALEYAMERNESLRVVSKDRFSSDQTNILSEG
jgi:hypothetical protein